MYGVRWKNKLEKEHAIFRESEVVDKRRINMGFIKWLYAQYKKYKLEKMLPEISEEEKGRIYMRNFIDCMELGFSREQLIALINLISNK